MCVVVFPVSDVSADPASADKIQRVFDVKIHQALEAFEKADYARTNQYADEAEIILPGQAITKNLKGAVLYKQQKYDEALAIFDQVMAIDPSSFAGYFNRGEVKTAQKKYDEALDIYRMILKSWPDNDLCKFRIVVVLLLKGDMREATDRANEMPLPGLSAAPFFARAAVAYQSGDSRRGMDWINQSETYFSRQDSKLLREVMVESGWWKADQK